MSVKRSRIGRSSSSGDSPDRLWNTHTAPHSFAASQSESDSANKTLKQSPMKERSPERILTVSSPVPVMEKPNVAVSTGAFFEKCYFCKKRIGPKDNVFMFGYLRAFCSPECRNEQISMDSEMEIVSEVLTESMAEPGRMNDGKNLFGYQVEKHAAPQSQFN